MSAVGVNAMGGRRATLRTTIGGLFMLGCLTMQAPANAQTVKLDMTPGLWLNKVTYVGDGAEQMQNAYGGQMQQAMEEMKKQMANMPAEQRKMMQEAMAASGISIGEEGVSINNNSVKLGKEGIEAEQCVLQEDIDMGLLQEADDNCDTSLQQLGAKRFKHTQVCQGGQASTMVSEIEFLSKTHYKGTGSIKQTVNGQQYDVDMTIEGKWLAADCGDID